MPELPEVDAIAGVVKLHAPGRAIEQIEILRQNRKYFWNDLTPVPENPWLVDDAFRIGKWVVMRTHVGPLERYVVVHNAMTGYFDWAHDPWCFDYVEAKRKSTSSDIRVILRFDGGYVLRFHDVRLFGRMYTSHALPDVGPELIQTPNGMPGRELITLERFAHVLYQKQTPIKSLLMEQSFIGGIGNIYANEACHLAGVDPSTPSDKLYPGQVPLLFEALKAVVECSIPTVRYDWLKVYRRSTCGSCGGRVEREELKGRATFYCPRCQS